MPSTSEFLIERLKNAGVGHVFGVPGDYVLQLFKKMEDDEKIELITTTDEAHAGFAADAYARAHGVGAICVTYIVGALKVANAVACAYAERSPIVVIAGSPGIKEREEGLMLHHTVRDFECQKDIFEAITCANTVLDNPSRAGYEIDRVLAAMQHHKQPVYIELPRDVANKPISYDVYKQGTPTNPKSDVENLCEAIDEVAGWIKESSKPVILAGVEVSRFGLGSELTKFAERLNLPICTTLLSKSVIDERHPLFRGVYMGGASLPDVQSLVEESDCLLMFGVMLTDVALSFQAPRFYKRQVVSSTVESLKVRNHTYTDVLFEDFCRDLFKIDLPPKKRRVAVNKEDPKPFVARPKPLTTIRFFEKINSILEENMILVVETGDALFGAADLVVRKKNHFLSPAFYTSMGTAIPGALGVQLALPDERVIVIVGDGGFQMSCTELSTIAHREFDTIVFVLNNHGYATERQLLNGSFNDVANWKYHRIIEMLDKGSSFEVTTEEELVQAVDYALQSDELTVINVVVEPDDISPVLKRITEGLGKNI